MASTDDDLDALRPVRIEDGVVTRPAAAWSPTVHAFLRHLRDQGLICVPEPVAVEGDVERLVVIDGDSGADGWGHQHSEAGLRSAARLLRTIHDASVGWEPPPEAVFCAPDVVSGSAEPCGATAMSDPGTWCGTATMPWA